MNRKNRTMNFIETVEADAEVVITDVKAGLNFLKTEGSAAIAWVDSEVPGAQVAMANFVAEAEKDAATLTTLGAQGLDNAIAAAAPEVETLIANLISATGLVKLGAAGSTAGTTLDALDVAGVSTVQTILNALVSTGLTTVLGKLAPQASGAS